MNALKTKLCKATKKDLRAVALNKSALADNNAWALQVPYDVRDEGMKDVLKAIDSNQAKIAKGSLQRFDLSFRSAKDEQQSLVIHAKHWKHKTGVYSDLCGENMKSSEPLPVDLGHDCRLMRTKLGHYYLCLCLPIESENQALQSSKQYTIALDPGVRTFLTGYDADGQVVEWGTKDMSRLYRLCRAVDDLQSRWSQLTHRKRYKLQRAARRIRLKVRNLVDELHKKCSTWLCRNYRSVILPVFESSNMVIKGQRKINSKTARSMLTWAHYRFRQRLLNKSRQYNQCHIVLTAEPYTSKTCGRCGWLHQKLGGNKTFQCQSCGLCIDRDVNGARNILLRHLTLSCPLVDSVGSQPLDL